MPLIRNQTTGEQAWFDETTGAITPVKIEGNVQPADVQAGVQGQVGPQLQRVRNKQTGALAVFDPSTGQVFPEKETTQQIQSMGQTLQEGRTQLEQPPPEAKVQEVQRGLSAGITRPMGAISDIDVTGGKPKLVPPAPSPGISLENLTTPAAVAGAAALGAGALPVAALGAGVYGATRALQGKEFDPVGTALSAIPIQAPKALLRTASGLFGRGPLKKAAGTMLEEARASTKPVTMTNTATALQGEGRTIPSAVKTTVQELDDLATQAHLQGKPLNYGEWFTKFGELEEQTAAAFRAKQGSVGGPLRKIKDAIMSDLEAAGPEAKQALEAYKRASGMLGGIEGAKKILKSIPYAYTLGAVTAGAVKPATLAITAPAALIGGVTNLFMRLPGVGEPIARALIKDPKSISQGAWNMILQFAESRKEEY